MAIITCLPTGRQVINCSPIDIYEKIILLPFIILFGLKSFAQETGNDSYTIQRSLIYNQTGEVLLEKK